MKKIVIIGAGYVGLVSATCFAKKGHSVLVVENDPNKLKLLLTGKPYFYEPNLEALIKEVFLMGRLQFSSSIFEALADNPEIIFSCVGTPSLDDGSVDLSYVQNVATEIGKSLKSYSLVVNKSTVPVGCTKEVCKIIQAELDKRNIKIKFDVASNPEFLKEGTAVNDSLYPDRVVVGVESKKAEQILFELYKPFLTKEDQFLVMSCESSELTKYASNAMLATRISFMNQLALFADKVGADISKVKLGMSYDKRIGAEFLNAGIGYGGSCFPKDVRALISMGNVHKQPMTIIKEVENVNNRQRQWFIDAICKYYGKSLQGKKVAVLGLAFKPGTDDIRYAPSIDLISQFISKGVIVTACDLVAIDNVKKIFGSKITYTSLANKALLNADFAVVLTEWEQFKNLSIDEWLVLKDKVVFDGRNCLNAELLISNNIKYFCVGRNTNYKSDFVVLSHGSKKADVKSA